MFSSNAVTLCGYVINSGNARFFHSGYGLCAAFELCTREEWYTKAEGKTNHYELHHVIVRDRPRNELATNSRPFLREGSRLLISGRLRTRVMYLRQGQSAMPITEIDADTVELLQSQDPEFEYLPRSACGREAQPAGSPLVPNADGAKDDLASQMESRS